MKRTNGTIESEKETWNHKENAKGQTKHIKKDRKGKTRKGHDRTGQDRKGKEQGKDRTGQGK